MVGSWLRRLWVLVLGVALAPAAELTMRVCDAQGEALTHVAQNVPFFVVVEIAGADTPVAPLVEHADKLSECTLIRTGTKTTFNIQTRVQRTVHVYTYRAVVAQCGQYALGPASITDGTTRVQSNAVQLLADACQQVTHDPFVLLASVNKESAYVGERVLLTVRFCWSEPLREVAFSLPPLADVTAYQIARIDDEPYQYQGRVWQSRAWVFALFAHKPGTMCVPRLTAQCQVGFWFGRTFNVYAAPLTLPVNALPPHDGTVDVVGQSSTFQVQLDRHTIRQSEAATLTLSVNSSGNVPGLFVRLLAEVPIGLKMHECPCSMVPDSKDYARWTIRREYVVQGLALGQFQIPAQQLIYFDPDHGLYGVLKSKPLVLTVIADGGASAAPVIGRAVSALSYELFCLLVGLVFLIAMVAYVGKQYRARHACLTWRRLQRGIRHACKKRDALGLYRWWILFVADRTRMGPEHVTTAVLVDFGQKKMGDTQAQRAAWQRYVLRLEQAAFGGLAFDDELIKQTHEWLRRGMRLW